jgi:hypothetical protein
MAGTAVDYPDVLLDILQLYCPGNVTITTFSLADSLDNTLPPAPACVAQEVPRSLRDNSRGTRGIFPLVYLHCVGTTRVNARHVQQEIRDAADLYDLGGGMPLFTVSVAAVGDDAHASKANDPVNSTPYDAFDNNLTELYVGRVTSD